MATFAPGASALQQLLTALDKLAEGLALYDAHDRLVSCNRAYVDLWAEVDVRVEPGLDYKVLLRKALEAGCFPEARGREAEWLAERLAARLQSHRVYDRRTTGGRWVRMDSRLTDDGGRICSVVDITDLKAREAEAKEALAFLDTIIEGVPAPLVVKDGADGRYLIINRAAEDMLGVSRTTHLGKTGHDLFTQEQADQFAEQDQQVLTSGELRIIEEEAVQTPNNGVRYLRTKKIGVRPSPDRSFLVTIAEDITERKRTHEALQAALAQAEAADRAKSLFLANMSHEVRTPLNGVAGVADVLAHSRLTGPQRELVELIRTSARMVDILLADILELSRIDGGRAQAVSDDFPLGRTVQERVELYKPSADAKGLRLEVSIDPGAEVWVRGDAARLKQILSILLSNAIKFTEAGEIGVAVAPAGEGRFRIEVRDTGQGFDPADKASLFERFTQGDGSATRKHSGAGLGLALARECAGLLAGEIDCEAIPGEGAVFVLSLPLPGGRDPAEARPAPPVEGRETRDGDAEEFRALIVDDNPVNRKVLELILDQLGAAWVSVEDGRQAVEAFAAQRFSVVLMDIQMPIMDGLAATREIRKLEAARNQPTTPVIIVSANCLPEHVKAGVEAGAQQHLVKPVNAGILIEAITKVLEEHDDCSQPIEQQQA